MFGKSRSTTGARLVAALMMGFILTPTSAAADTLRKIVEGARAGPLARILPLERVAPPFFIDDIQARAIARSHGLKPPFRSAQTPYGWSLFKIGNMRAGPTIVVLFHDGQLLAVR